MGYNIQAARDAGLADTQIANHLAGLHGYKIEAARAAGLSDTQIADHLAEKSTTLAKVSNALSTPTVADKAESANYTPVNTHGIHVDGNGNLSTVSDRAMDIATQRVMSPKSDQPEDLMAKASKFVAGSTSPSIAEQDAVTRKPEQVMAGAIDSSERYMARKQQEEDVATSKRAGLRQATAEAMPYNAAALSGLSRIGSNLADIPQFANDAVKHFVINPVLHLAGQDGMLPTQRFAIAKDLENTANEFSPKVKNIEDINFRDPKEVGHWAAVNALQQAPQMALGTAASFIPKLRAGYLGIMGAMSGASQYQQNLEKGVGEDRAMMDGITNGLFEVIGESLGFGIFDKLKAPLASMTSMQRAGVAKEMAARLLIGTSKVAGQVAGEGFGEGVTQLGQNASQKYIAGDKTQNLDDGVLNAAAIGALMGVPTATAHGYHAATQPITSGQELGAALQDSIDGTQLDSRGNQAAAIDALSQSGKQYSPLTEKAAAVSARQKTQATGIPHEVVPHPAELGKFMAVPAPQASESAQQSAASTATDTGALNADAVLGVPEVSLSDAATLRRTEALNLTADKLKGADAINHLDSFFAAHANKPADAKPIVTPEGVPAPRIAAHIGHASEVVLPDNTALPAQWEVVDADHVAASLKEGIAQPRDRSRAASNAQVQGIANAPDYRRLADSPVMDVGAPTLSHDGVIVGGNGRFEGVSRAYDNGTASEYRARLKADAVAKGIDPAVIDGMTKPVLVRRVTQPFDTRALAVASNSGGSLQYSALEMAKLDGERMKSIGDIDVTDAGDIALSSINMANVRRALAGYSAAELGSMTDKDGMLSQEGMRRIKNALIFKAYGDSTTLARLVESTDNDLRVVSGALIRAAGKVAQVRGDMASGAIPAELDIAADIVGAVEQLSKIKASGATVEQYLAQQSLLGAEISDEAVAVLHFLADNMRSQKRIAEFITSYYDALANEDHATGAMFADIKPTTKQERLNAAIQQNTRPSESRSSDSTGTQDGRQPTHEDRTDGGTSQSASGDGYALSGQTQAEVKAQEQARLAAEKATRDEESQAKAAQAAKDQAEVDTKIKARTDNADNFQFGESSRDAAKPVADLFAQPTKPKEQPTTASKPADARLDKHGLVIPSKIPKLLKIPNPATGKGKFSASKAMMAANQRVEKLEALRKCLG